MIKPVCQHEKCREPYTTHSVCVMAPPLKVKVLDRMIEKVNALAQTFTPQANHRIGEYAQVEVLWKR